MVRTLLLLASAGVFVSPATAPAQGPVIITSVSTNACNLPAVPKGARVVLFSAYEGDAIASSVIGDEDQETNLINVVIEPGTEPLYVVLSSYKSMIWRFTGATKRVVQVVATSADAKRSPLPAAKALEVSNGSPQLPRENGAPIISEPALPLAGVAGIPKQQVKIARSNCPRYATDGPSINRTARSLAEALNKPPRGAYATYSAAAVYLPSGQIENSPASSQVPRGFAPEQWAEASRFWPGGVATVSPKQVVASTKVQPYRVLPSQLGIAQLVGSGALIPLSSRDYRVIRPIPHMPPGMGGAHAVILRFASGVPIPPGDPVHSCIIEEAISLEKA